MYIKLNLKKKKNDDGITLNPMSHSCYDSLPIQEKIRQHSKINESLSFILQWSLRRNEYRF